MTPSLTSIGDLISTFSAGFPELLPAGLTIIQAKLELARLRVDRDVWGTRTDAGILVLAADLIASSPGGNPVRIKVDGRPMTTYAIDYQRMMLEVWPLLRPIA